MTEIETGKAAIRSYLDAVGSLDVDAIAPLFTPDGVLDLPYAPDGFPKSIVGQSAIDEFYQALPAMVTPMNFANYRISSMETPGEFVAEYTSDSSMKASGNPYRNNYVARVSVRDGKITRFAEYFDPISLVKALGGEVRPPTVAESAG